jgi:hypothetical protein
MTTPRRDGRTETGSGESFRAESEIRPIDLVILYRKSKK